MKIAIAAAAALALAGCAPGEMPDWSAANFCSIAKKQTWSVGDTAATIDQVRRHNARVDQLCGKPQ